MLYDTLVRAISRGNYTTKEEITEKVNILYSNEKINAEQDMILMEMIYEGGE